MQPPHLLGGQRVGGAQRVEPRPPQRLVRVDVADPGDEGLVQQQRLEPGRSPLSRAARRAELKEWASGSGPWRANTSPTRYGSRFSATRRRPPRRGARWHPAPLPEPDPSELAHVPVAQLTAIGQAKDDARVRVVGRPGRGHDQRPGHAQRDGHAPAHRRGAAGRSSRAARPAGSSRRAARRRTAHRAEGGGSSAPSGPRRRRSWRPPPSAAGRVRRSRPRGAPALVSRPARPRFPLRLASRATSVEVFGTRRHARPRAGIGPSAPSSRRP